MLELALALKLVRRSLSPLLLLCLTGLLLVLMRPLMVTLVGFQLSFLSTFGLLAMTPPLEERLGYYLTRWGANLLLVPVIAQLWVTPILVADFNQVPLLSLPANIVALPVVALETYAGFVLGAISLVSPAMSGWMLDRLGMVSGVLFGIASWFGNAPGAIWWVATPPVFVTVLGMVALFVGAAALHRVPLDASWLRFGHRPGVRLGVLAGVLALLLPLGFAHWQNRQQTTLTWLGSAESPGPCLIRTPSGAVFLRAARLTPGIARGVAGVLRRHGVRELSLIMLDTVDARSVEGLQRLAQTIRITQIALPPQTVEQLSPLVQWTAPHDIAVYPITSTSRIAMPGSVWTLAAPSSEGLLARLDTPTNCMVWGPTLSPIALTHWGTGCALRYDADWSRTHHVLYQPQRRLPVLPARGYHQLALTGSGRVVLSP